MSDNLANSTTYDGRTYSLSTTPLGLAIPIYTGTALGGGGLPVWNPPNSGVNLELIEVSTARTSGTSDFGAIGVMARPLAAIATGAVLTALDETNKPINGLLFRGQSSRARASNTGTNTVSAGAVTDWIRALFTFNLEADTGTAHATTLAKYEFNGTLVVPPGYFVYLAATKASVALFASTIIWRETVIA